MVRSKFQNSPLNGNDFRSADEDRLYMHMHVYRFVTDPLHYSEWKNVRGSVPEYKGHFYLYAQPNQPTKLTTVIGGAEWGMQEAEQRIDQVSGGWSHSQCPLRASGTKSALWSTTGCDIYSHFHRLWVASHPNATWEFLGVILSSRLESLSSLT